MGLKKKLFQKMFNRFNKFSASINLKPTELDLKDKKCLCLAPHPDDETIGMGGLLALYGEQFDVVLLTDGRKGIKEKSAQEVIEIRYKEFEEALALAKVSKHSFLDAVDKKLLTSRNKLENIDFKDYDYIFLPNIIDQHPDHKAISLLLKDLLDLGLKLKSDVKICMYEVWSTLGLVNAFVDVSSVIEVKKAMINCYKSQIAQKDYEYHALGLNQYRGMFKDKKYVEAFFVMDLEEFKQICELY